MDWFAQTDHAAPYYIAIHAHNIVLLLRDISKDAGVLLCRIPVQIGHHTAFVALCHSHYCGLITLSDHDAAAYPALFIRLLTAVGVDDEILSKAARLDLLVHQT